MSYMIEMANESVDSLDGFTTKNDALRGFTEVIRIFLSVTGRAPSVIWVSKPQQKMLYPPYKSQFAELFHDVPIKKSSSGISQRPTMLYLMNLSCITVISKVYPMKLPLDPWFYGYET